MNKLNILKKNVLFLAGALLLAGCAKVAETPIEVPAEVPVGKTYTIIADLDNPATRSLTAYDETTNKFKFTWEENEVIGVVPGGYSSVLNFKAVDPANGRFSFQQSADDPNVYNSFVMAVSPRAALGSVTTGDNTVSYTVNYIGEYFQGQSNAIMVAGAATPGSDGTQRFQFKHVGALVKVSYANVPAGTSAMVFSTPDHDITGSFTFNSATGVEVDASPKTTNNEARVIFMNAPTEVQASVDFYLPIPTGQYQTFNVKLVDANDETIAGSEQTFSTASPFTVARADVVRCPVVTIQDVDYSGEWIMVGMANEKYYACPAYTSGKNNIPGVEVAVDGEVVSSDNTTLKMTISKVTSGQYQGMYTIMDANGLYLYAASTGSNHLKGDEVSDPSSMAATHYWSITPDEDGTLSIVASKATDHRNVLQMNPNNGSPLFACYADANSNYSNISLYSWDKASITLICDTPTISFDGTNVSIETTTPGATIYYTLDGTDPTTSSLVYTAPFVLSETKTVKAMAVAPDYENSEIATKECVVGSNWTLVTSSSELVAGDMIVIACNTKGAVAGPLSGDYLSKKDATFTSDLFSINSLPDDALQFVLGGSEGAWTLTCDAGQLYSSAAKKVNFSSNGNGKWKISFNGNNAIVENGNANYGKLYYNSSNPRFTTYTSAQTAIQLYRKPAGEDTREDAELSFSPASATAVVGEDFIAPQLTKNPSDISVTWTSSDPTVAYIDQESGAIQIKKAGETTIKAAFAGNSQYKPASASYQLTVNPSYAITLQDVTDGKVFVGAANNSQVTFKVSSGYAWNTNVSFEGEYANSFSITPTQGDAGDEIVVTVSSAIENDSNAERQLGSVTISNGGSTQTILVWQKGKVDDWSKVNESNITLTAYGNPANATAAFVVIGENSYNALKAGTNQNAGIARIKVPGGTTNLHLHIAGWNGESVTVTITGASSSPSALNLTADSGISGAGTSYTLNGNTETYYKVINLSNISDDTILTLTASSGKRFVIWGVNAE